MPRIPDSPEGVALALFKTILKADPSLLAQPTAQPIAATMLDLYAECLTAASGSREDRMKLMDERLGLGGRLVQ
jgi:hypothetical protein